MFFLPRPVRNTTTDPLRDCRLNSRSCAGAASLLIFFLYLLIFVFPFFLYTVNRNMPQTSSTIAAVLVAAFAVYCVVYHGRRRERARAKYAEENVVIVRGTVLLADVSYDPDTRAIECRQLVVRYPGFRDEPVVRSFSGSGAMLERVPQIGSTVLVAWNRVDPSVAYVRSVA